MRRTFAIDVLACSHCGGRLQLRAAVINPNGMRDPRKSRASNYTARVAPSARFALVR
jgi:hypothetical protein